jgi:hypothetical protein
MIAKESTVASITIRNLAAAIGARFQPLGGVDLELPAREPMREPPQVQRPAAKNVRK